MPGEWRVFFPHPKFQHPGNWLTLLLLKRPSANVHSAHLRGNAQGTGTLGFYKGIFTVFAQL